MAVNDMWEVTIRGVCLTQPAFNVFHYLTNTEAGGAPTKAQILAAFRSKVESSLVSLTNQLYTIVQYTCQLRYAAGAPYQAPRGLLDVLASNTSGAGTSEVLAPQLAVYMKIYAEQSPAFYLRGAKFFGGIGEGAVVNGTITSAAYTTALALATKLTENLAVGTGSATILKPVVYSPKRHSLGATPYVLPVTSIQVATTVKTLRRRTLGTPIGGY